MTQKQELFVEALANGAPTVTAAAKKAGISRSRAQVLIQKEDIAAKVESLKLRRYDREADKARRIAEKALARVETSLERMPENGDPREIVQVSALAIGAAAKHTEAYGERLEEEDEEGARARAKRKLYLYLLRGIELGRSGRDLTELVAILRARTALSPRTKTSMKTGNSTTSKGRSKK